MIAVVFMLNKAELFPPFSLPRSVLFSFVCFVRLCCSFDAGNVINAKGYVFAKQL